MPKEECSKRSQKKLHSLGNVFIKILYHKYLTPSVPETNVAEFANCVDLDEVAHKEPPHLELDCLPSSL